MRNITEIHFSDTTGNGKFSGKPDLPVEIFFLACGSARPPHAMPRTAPARGWLQESDVGKEAVRFVLS